MQSDCTKMVGIQHLRNSAQFIQRLLPEAVLTLVDNGIVVK